MRIAIKNPDFFGHVGGLSPLHITSNVIEAMIPVLIQENPEGWAGPHSYKFFTTGMYGAAAAWSPNLESPDLVDMPIDLNTQTVIEPVAQVWNMNSIFALIQFYPENVDKLGSIYFDCGDKDELKSLLTNDALHGFMSSAGLTHHYEVYDGYHISNFYSRLEIVLHHITESMTN
jgi:S-formylglutathione hydrolase FrmB